MKGSIYAIRSHQTQNIYIGSTIQKLCSRIASHRADFKKRINKKYSCSSFEILKYNDAYIELIEIVEFNEKTELFAREGHYIRTMECVNKNIPNRTDKEYQIDNKEKINIYLKQYYIDNKNKILEQQTEYYKNNKEQKRQYYIKNKQKENN